MRHRNGGYAQAETLSKNGHKEQLINSRDREKKRNKEEESVNLCRSQELSIVLAKAGGALQHV